jgi:hypothetical protein
MARKLGPRSHSGLQTLSVGSIALSVGRKSQVIGAKEQGRSVRPVARLLYMMLASPIADSCSDVTKILFQICAGDHRAQLRAGHERAYETHVRTHPPQSSSKPLYPRLNGIIRRWCGLIKTARNPYRPELHYMRGPGPKWCAKHQGK